MSTGVGGCKSWAVSCLFQQYTIHLHYHFRFGCRISNFICFYFTFRRLFCFHFYFAFPLTRILRPLAKHFIWTLLCICAFYFDCDSWECCVQNRYTRWDWIQFPYLSIKMLFASEQFTKWAEQRETISSSLSSNLVTYFRNFFQLVFHFSP